MENFSYYYDSQQTAKANVFRVVEATGKVLAGIGFELTKLREYFVSNNAAGAVRELRAEMAEWDKTHKTHKALVQVLQETGKETLTSEIVQRVREDNNQLEATVENLKRELKRKDEELEKKQVAQMLLALPSEQVKEILEPLLRDLLLKMRANEEGKAA